MSYCPICKGLHSLQKDTHTYTEGTLVKVIAVLVDCAIGIF